MRSSVKKEGISISAPESEQIVQLLSTSGRPLKTAAIFNKFKFGQLDKKELKKILMKLARDRKILELPDGKWASPDLGNIKTGIINFYPSGYKFVPENENTEIPVKISQSAAAWDKDRVRALVSHGDDGPTAKVLEILDRTQKEVAARFLRRDGKNIICRTVARRTPVYFSIYPEKSRKERLPLKPGQLVTVRPEKPLQNGNWLGTLVHTYDKENVLSLQEALVKLNHNVPEKFPEKALLQARSLPPNPKPEEVKNRADLRDIDFITIDGKDARDFDDAIFVKKTDAGWLLKVAIADVSHYVKADNDPESLNGEALRRSNSWYFPKSVEPMLPKELSNGLCSLNPDVERLAVVVEMPFGEDGTPGQPSFTAAVIKSKARLTYDQVAEFYNGNNKSVPEFIQPMLQEAKKLYKILSKKRRQRGSLDFDLPEASYVFSEDGSLSDIRRAERNDAHMLIEEFMIAANETVSKWLESRKLPFPFRVHASPEASKLISLYDTLEKTTPDLITQDLDIEELGKPANLQRILNKARNTSQEYLVNRLCLRSMSQAKYQPENIGHFALASPSYCHFTSPIRRYADLLVHRALKASLGLTKKEDLPDHETLEKIGEQLNKQERSAIDCEREMAKRLACLLFSQKSGQELEGIISGVTEFGIFVEFTDIPAEGIIKIRDLDNDWFEPDQQKQMLIGQRSGKTFQLGQPVKVKIQSIDEDRMEVRLSLAGSINKRKSQNKDGHSAKRRSYESEKRQSANQGEKGRFRHKGNPAKSRLSSISAD